jgi:hypothetical protein
METLSWTVVTLASVKQNVIPGLPTSNSSRERHCPAAAVPALGRNIVPQSMLNSQTERARGMMSCRQE